MRLHEGQANSLNQQQFQDVIEHVKATSRHIIRDIAILQVSYRCGLRAMEIAGLNLTDLVNKNGDINKHIPLRKKTTKGSRGGVAYFTHPDVRVALEEYIVEIRSKISTDCNKVFLSQKGTPFSASSMSRLFGTLYKKAGMEGCTGHTGRRSLARNLNAQNVSVYNIQKILRHASIETTVNHYLSVDEEVLANIVGNTV